jgi:Holliday junction resolvase RusA-like endonuclease
MENQGILKEAVHKPVRFTISLAPVTKKNHGRIITIKGRAMMIPSKQYEAYEKKCKGFLPWDVETINYPVNVRAFYYMPTRRAVDLINLHGALHDALVKHKLIADDCCNIIVGTDGSRVLYDKENPRTEVYIEEVVGAILLKEAK